MSERRYEFSDGEDHLFWIDEEGRANTECPSSHMEFGKFADFAGNLASVADTLKAERDDLWAERDSTKDTRIAGLSREIATIAELEATEKDLDGCRDDALACQLELNRANATIARLTAELASLRAFAQAVMESWPESDVDGGELQDMAERHGLLRPETRTEPCGEDCLCAEVGDFPTTCYRKTGLLKGTP